MEPNHIIEKKYPDHDLFYLNSLDLYHGKQQDDSECFINNKGDLIYSTPKNTRTESYFTNFFPGIWSEQRKEFNREIKYWLQIKLAETGVSTFSAFTFKNNQIIPLLQQERIIWAEPLSPTKILLQTAIDDKSNSHLQNQVSIYDTEKNELKNITTTPLGKPPYEDSALVVHKIHGFEYLFSVLVDRRKDNEGDYNHDIYILFNHKGERLTNFETTIGQNGEKTWFEPGKRGLGIAYKLLEKRIHIPSGFYYDGYQICNSLIDVQGNYYGDFYYIFGKIPESLGKTSTRHPKYIDKKLLCLSLPDEKNPNPCLAIIDEHNNILQTQYECPWLFAFVSRALIKDKNIFGKTCITVLDAEDYVRLIDLDGKEIPGTSPIKFESLRIEYTKIFMKQANTV